MPLTDFTMRFCWPLLGDAAEVDFRGCALSGACARQVVDWVLESPIPVVNQIPTRAALDSEEHLVLEQHGGGEFDALLMAELLARGRPVTGLKVTEMHLEASFGAEARPAFAGRQQGTLFRQGIARITAPSPSSASACTVDY